MSQMTCDAGCYCGLGEECSVCGQQSSIGQIIAIKHKFILLINCNDCPFKAKRARASNDSGVTLIAGHMQRLRSKEVQIAEI